MRLLKVVLILFFSIFLVVETSCGESLNPNGKLRVLDTGVLKASGKMVHPRYGHRSILLKDGKVLVVGGRTLPDFVPGKIRGGSYVFIAEVYDPERETFEAVGKIDRYMGELHSNEELTLLEDGKVLITGGYRKVKGDSLNSKVSLPANSASIYSPVTKTFKKLSGMNVPRVWHTATLLPSGKVLIIGGLKRIKKKFGVERVALSSAELFDPKTETFSLLPEKMKIERVNHEAVLINNKSVYIIGGNSKKNERTKKMELPILIEKYDIATGKFSSSGDWPIGQVGHSFLKLDDSNVLVFGGSRDIKGRRYGSVSLDRLYLADFDKNQVQKIDLHYKYAFPYVSMVDDNIFLLFAYGSTNIEQCDLREKTCTHFLTPFTDRRVQHSITRLNDGSVIFIGGTTSEGERPKPAQMLGESMRYYPEK